MDSTLYGLCGQPVTVNPFAGEISAIYEPVDGSGLSPEICHQFFERTLELLNLHSEHVALVQDYGMSPEDAFRHGFRTVKSSDMSRVGTALAKEFGGDVVTKFQGFHDTSVEGMYTFLVKPGLLFPRRDESGLLIGLCSRSDDGSKEGHPWTVRAVD